MWMRLSDLALFEGMFEIEGFHDFYFIWDGEELFAQYVCGDFERVGHIDKLKYELIGGTFQHGGFSHTGFRAQIWHKEDKKELRSILDSIWA